MGITSEYAGGIPTAGPIEDCDACSGRSGSMRIDGLCLLHYVAREYSIEEFERAMKEVEEFEEVRSEIRDSKDLFKERARSVFPDRRVMVNLGYQNRVETFIGDNIYWQSNPRRGTADHFHADKNCPHLPDGSLKAYSKTYIYRNLDAYGTPDPCSHCTRIDEGEE